MSDLRDVIAQVKASSRQRETQCPAHEDRRASLSVGLGSDARVLLYCHAGCSLDAILDRAGLTLADLHERPSPGRQEVARYPYMDERGVHLYDVVRYFPKDFRQQRADGSWSMTGVRRVLYHLPRLKGQHVAYVVEGEKDADRLWQDKLAGTTNPGGAGKWRDDYTNQLKDAGVQYVVILPDNDEPGQAHAETVARSCQAAGLAAKIVPLPNVPPKGDASDWFGAGGTRAQLLNLARDSPRYVPGPVAIPPEQPPSRDSSPTQSRESQATAVVRLAADAGVELWHTPVSEAYITIDAGQHHEHYLLNSRTAKDYLSRLYFKAKGTAPTASALADAINALAGRARFDGAEHPVHVRVANHQDRIYLDLCDASWQAVEIDATGWRVVTSPPVRFRRSGGMRSLPVPQRGGSVKDLRPFMNLASEDDFALVTAWLVQAMCPRGPYPVMIALGEQGSCKSTFCRILRRLVDPSMADTRCEPRNVHDLMIAADNGHVVSLDNLSKLPEWLSDALCRLATGGGFSTRTLYENREEEIFDAQRPVILNGIAQVAARPDLVDRAVVVTLPHVPDTLRRDEDVFWRDFEAARPQILGALLDGLVMAIRRRQDVRLVSLPRMADFAIWAIAAEPAFPWPTGTFFSAYIANRRGSIDEVLDGDPVAECVRALAPWTGTAADFLGALNARVDEDVRRQRGWFTKPRQVSEALQRLAPALRRDGFEVKREREPHTRRRLIRVVKDGSDSSPSSPSSPSAENRSHLAISGDLGPDEMGTQGDAGFALRPPKTSIGDAGDAGNEVKHTFTPREAASWTPAGSGDGTNGGRF